MSFEKFVTVSKQEDLRGRYAVVDAKSNELLHTFKTDMIARAYQQSTPDSKVIWMSRRTLDEVLRNN